MNTKINIKKRVCACGCNKTGYIFSKGLLKECWAKQFYKGIKKQDERLDDKLIKVHSLYIRLKDADKNEMVTCFVCGVKLHYKNAHNSHYIDRIHKATRFNNDNCHVSCPDCNYIHNSNKEPYKQALEKWKQGISQELEELKYKTIKHYKNELLSLIDFYSKEVELLLSNLIKKK